MRLSPRFITALAITGLLWFLSPEAIKFVKEVHFLETRPSSIQNSAKNKDYLQKNTGVLHELSYQYQSGALPQGKKLLTVGLCSVHRPKGNYLLNTLKSVFKSLSTSELRYITVLVHLADPNLVWLNQTIAKIVTLFTPQILARKLIMIHAPPATYASLRVPSNANNLSDLEAKRLKQNLDYVFLMSFAANLSEYFLMIEDDVHCARHFVTSIRGALRKWKDRSWTILEFSNLGFIGKLFHSRDLLPLTQFLLLFNHKMPPDLFFSHFLKLFGQKKAIHISPSLFYHVGVYSSFDGSYSDLRDQFQESYYGLPHNPPASIHTDMQLFSNHLPQNSYSVTKDYFKTWDPSPGSYLTVILIEPAEVMRVQVLTGTSLEKHYRLQEGNVEFGYHPTEEPKQCRQYQLIGSFFEGHFDMKIKKTASGHLVSCVKIVVTAYQENNWLIIRHINIWVDPEK